MITCCFCGGDAGKYGNSAQPLADAICCDNCNAHIVIPARMKALQKEDAVANLKSVLMKEVVEPIAVPCLKAINWLLGWILKKTAPTRFGDGISKCCGVAVIIETEEDFDGLVTPHYRCSKCKAELFPPRP